MELCSKCKREILDMDRSKATRVKLVHWVLEMDSARYTNFYDYHQHCMPNLGDVLGEPIHQSAKGAE